MAVRVLRAIAITLFIIVFAAVFPVLILVEAVLGFFGLELPLSGSPTPPELPTGLCGLPGRARVWCLSGAARTGPFASCGQRRAASQAQSSRDYADLVGRLKRHPRDRQTGTRVAPSPQRTALGRCARYPLGWVDERKTDHAGPAAFRGGLAGVCQSHWDGTVGARRDRRAKRERRASREDSPAGCVAEFEVFSAISWSFTAIWRLARLFERRGPQRHAAVPSGPTAGQAYRLAGALKPHTGDIAVVRGRTQLAIAELGGSSIAPTVVWIGRNGVRRRQACTGTTARC